MKWTRDYIGDDLELLKVLDATEYGVYKALKCWAAANYNRGEISLAGMAPDPKTVSKSLKLSNKRYDKVIEKLKATTYPDTDLALIEIDRHRILLNNWGIFQDDYDKRKTKNEELRRIARDLDSKAVAKTEICTTKNGDKTERSTTHHGKKTAAEVEVEVEVKVEGEKRPDPAKAELTEVYQYYFAAQGRTGILPPRGIMDELADLAKEYGKHKVNLAMVKIGPTGYRFANVRKVLNGTWRDNLGGGYKPDGVDRDRVED